MSIETGETSVRTSIVVEVGIEKAFATFVDMDSWWDADHHIIDGFERMEVEPRAGGRIVDHAKDGSSNSWARVLVWEPPARFVFSWDIDPDWNIETDLARTSEVHVTFTSQGDDRTLVELEHRHLDRHGEGWEGIRSAVASDNGWSLAAYAAAATR